MEEGRLLMLRTEGCEPSAGLGGCHSCNISLLSICGIRDNEAEDFVGV